ncbi:MAG: glycosyltransferase [Bacteroidales bacterium]|nr:glycosyltransferase [Bacteroidales bacterium]
MDAADRIIANQQSHRRIVILKYNIDDPEKVFTGFCSVEPLHPSGLKRTGRAYDDKIVVQQPYPVQKGPESLLRQPGWWSLEMPNVRFVMAGSGDMMERMMEMAAAAEDNRRVPLHHSFAAMYSAILRMSDVYVMPSVSEPFGISPLEAMQSNAGNNQQAGRVAELLTMP